MIYDHIVVFKHLFKIMGVELFPNKCVKRFESNYMKKN